jgi:hypothetical protein
MIVLGYGSFAYHATYDRNASYLDFVGLILMADYLIQYNAVIPSQK